MKKNINAIKKIISELALKDYVRYNPIDKRGRSMHKKKRPYTLSIETNEARQILFDYVNNKITEEEYKAYCLTYNLKEIK